MWADSCSITPPASAHAFLVVSDAAISIVRLSVVYDALEATIIVDAIWPSSSESPSTAGLRATWTGLATGRTTRTLLASAQTRSKSAAWPWPTPTHIVARP